MNKAAYLGYVEAAVQLPYFGKHLCFRQAIAPELISHFERLPRGRELSFLPGEAQRAREQQTARRELAHMLANVFAESIIRAVESNDTICGYEPDQWHSMHNPTRPPSHG